MTQDFVVYDTPQFIVDVDPDEVIFRKVMPPEQAARFRKRREQQRKWKENNPDKVKEQRRAYAPKMARKVPAWKAANAEKVAAHKARQSQDIYDRPFVTIDAEGMNIPGQDVTVGGVIYPEHRTFLWGAKGWMRKHSASALEKDPSLSLLEGEDTAESWLGDASKRPLSSLEILEWLTSLPAKFSPENGYPNEVNFIAFAFNYDATQILKDLPRKKVWEICRREKFGSKKKVKGPVFWKDFAIEYLKGKYLKVWKLKAGEPPYVPKLDENGNPVLKENGKPEKRLNSVAKICIYDTFGFYQESFVKATETLVKRGYLTALKHATIAANKAKRNQFENVDFETIKMYCDLELTTLAKALTLLRDGCNKLGIRLQQWSGAGAAASAFIRKKELKKNHYSVDIATYGISLQQERAHHAFFGGRIELIKQGYAEGKKLFVYDIASAYPSGCLELPSMKDGTWTHGGFLRVRDVQKDHANILSMFRVRWKFPLCKDDGMPVPFFPFPYRVRKKGLVLFPSEGYSWLMRDELLAGIAWFKIFFPGSKIEECIIIEEHSLFHPASDERPYIFLPDLYAWRKILKADGDITEKVIKLIINSLYGKTVQSVGGTPDRPPSSACPYYGAAITAWCRARLLKAALKDPYSVVSFMTDGIVSERPLALGALLKPENSPEVQLGDWEWKEVENGLFQMSGVYSYRKEVLNKDGTKEVKRTGKSRGFDPERFILKKDLESFFMEDILPAWKKPVIATSEGITGGPKFTYEIRRYISAGEAVASDERFKVIGRWADVPREINVLKPGPKRELDPNCYWAYVPCDNASPNSELHVPSLKRLKQLENWLGIPAREMQACLKSGDPLRCHYLVPTIPAFNQTPDILSAPSVPDWLLEQHEQVESEDGSDLIRVGDKDTAEILAGMN